MPRDILKDPPKHKARFEIAARVYQPNERVQQEVHASLDRLKGLLPADIDPQEHPTLLYVVGNLAVSGVLNLNDDAISIEDALRVYRAFEWQQINIEHNRGDIRGFVVKAGLSELGTDRLLTEEEARAANVPFNICIVFALWKVADKDLVKYILQSSAPGSPTRDALSLSFEVGFDDYSIVILPKGTSNLALAKETITSDSPSFARWDKVLRVNKGSGLTKDGRVGRVLAGEIIPLGGGVVTVPAAAVKGIAPITSVADVEDMEVEDEEDVDDAAAKVGVTYDYSSTQFTLAAADAEPFLSYAASISDEDLYTGEDGQTDSYGPKYGREDQTHTTILYGIHGTDCTALAATLATFGPVTLTMGKVTAFENVDKPYDVLKVEVLGDDIHRLHALIKTSVEHTDTWPTFFPHCTVAYLKRGLAARYVGDTRFEGKTLSFSTLTFSGTDGVCTELPLTAPQIPMLASTGEGIPQQAILDAAQAATPQVYTLAEDPHDLMAASTALSSQLHLSPGWEERLAALQTAAAPMEGQPPHGGDPLPGGVDVTLSDGRVLRNLKVFDGKTLQLDKETAFHGVIITDMTPGVPPQADDSKAITPRLGDVYPNKVPEKVAADEAAQTASDVARNAPYTDASLHDALTSISASLAALIASLSPLTPTPPAQMQAAAGVSSTTPPSMTLDDLKTIEASVKDATDVTSLKTAFANVALFAAEIAKASELAVKARQDAELAASTNAASLTEVKAQLADLTTRYNDAIAAQQAAAAEQVFQDRMAVVASTFTFDDETRAEVVAEIKACADEAAFAKWVTRATKLYKGWLKAEDAAAKAPPFGKDKEKHMEDEESECAKAAKEALASAAAKVVSTPISTMIDPAAVAAQQQTLKERFMAVASKNIRIGGEALGDITEKASKVVRKTR